jgi:hypothetical protein
MDSRRSRVPESWSNWALNVAKVSSTVGHAVKVIEAMADQFPALLRCRAALEELVRLKDGPRDDAYRATKDAAWDEAREALK